MNRDPAARPRLWLVRHGETDWSRLGRHTSRTDIPLTEAGRTQAVALAARLTGQRFAEVLTSPMSRAAETARITGFGDLATITDDLREWDYGRDEGRTTSEIQMDRPGWSLWGDGPQEGETIAEVAIRADRIVEHARLAPGDTLCFGHGHMLRVLAARWLELEPQLGSRFALSTATLSVLGWEHKMPVIERWNESPD